MLHSLAMLTAALSVHASEGKSIQAVKEQVLESEIAERQLLGTLYSINQRMKDMSKQRDRLTNRRLSTEGDVRSLAQTIAQLDERVVSQRTLLRARVRELYLLNGQSAMRSLFSAQNAMQFDRNLRFLKRLTDRDYGMIKDYERSLKTLLAKRRQLDGQVRRLASLKSALDKQELRLTHEQEVKGTLLGKLKNSRDLHLAELKTIRKAGQNSEFDASFFEKRGQLPDPVNGALVKSYGYIQDEEYRFRLGHKGLHFTTKTGEKVRSVFRGKVAFAGRLPGYGLSVIVDHGDHYYTVYGHLLALDIQKGVNVEQETVLGAAGGASPWFGEGLYFEMRHFSDAIDPQPWLKTTTTRGQHATNI